MLIALNKPYGVLCQFTDRSTPPRPTLAGFGLPAGVYPAGRLDFELAIAEGDAPDAIEALLSGLTSALSNRIDLEEQTHALRKPEADLKVIDLIWRGRWRSSCWQSSVSSACGRLCRIRKSPRVGSACRICSGSCRCRFWCWSPCTA